MVKDRRDNGQAFTTKVVKQGKPSSTAVEKSAPYAQRFLEFGDFREIGASYETH